MDPIYQNLDKYLYKLKSPIIVTDADPDGKSTQIGSLVVTSNYSIVDAPNATSGSVVGNLEYSGGYIQSSNYVLGTAGWRLSADGTLKAVNATLSGTITATAGTIGGFTIASGVLTGNGTTGKIQTASSGARVVIDSASNSLQVYDAVGQMLGIGTNSLHAIQVNLVAGGSGTDNGLFITSALAGNGFYYTNSANVAGRGIRIIQDSTGANNNLASIEITKAGSGHGILATVSGSVVGVYLANSGGGRTIQLDHTGTGIALDISSVNNTSGAAIDITRTCTSAAPVGIKMNVSTSGNSYAFEFAGGEYASSAVGGTQGKKIRVLIGGGVYYIPLYDA